MKQETRGRESGEHKANLADLSVGRRARIHHAIHVGPSLDLALPVAQRGQRGHHCTRGGPEGVGQWVGVSWWVGGYGEDSRGHPLGKVLHCSAQPAKQPINQRTHPGRGPGSCQTGAGRRAR